MRRSMTYANALRLLGEKESRLVALADTITSGAVAASGHFELIEIRREAVDLGSKVLRSLGERLRGLSGLTHRERVYAAHSVLVITAFFQALDEVGERLGIDPVPGLGADEQAALSIGTAPGVGWPQLVIALAYVPIAEPHAVSIDPVASYYEKLAASTHVYLQGLAPWDSLDETRRGQLTTLVLDEVPGLALEAYEERLRHLAAVSTEFRVWLTLCAQQEVRDDVLTGLAGLEDLLTLTRNAVSSDRRGALSRAYRATLAKPIVPSGENDTGLTIPSLAEGYIDHRFQFAYRDHTVGEEHWWRDQPTSDGLVRFLAAHLVSPVALISPLLILGQPGSGKSVLTRVLAARLPEEQYLPVRVELRAVDADADLQEQIEAAVQLATGETVQWPRFVDAAAGAIEGSGRPGEFHPWAPTEPYVNLSAYTALVVLVIAPSGGSQIQCAKYRGRSA